MVVSKKILFGLVFIFSLSCYAKKTQVKEIFIDTHKKTTEKRRDFIVGRWNIDLYEIEKNYSSEPTSFSTKNGWYVDLFEPKFVDEEEEDQEVYEIDKLFSEALTEGFPSELRKFEKWEIGQYGSYNIPVELNEYVDYYIYLFTQTEYRKHYEKWLRRYFLYSGIIRKILVSHGLPDDLVFVAMAESGFSNRAVSPMGAVGMWQFIYGTALRYNLKIDRWVDERRDVIKSTIAAINYLKDLYQMFGDWYLAWAAYNAGEKRVQRAIKKTGSKNFWYILRRRKIPRETAGYVPKIIALAIITKNLEKFGFDKNKFYQEPLSFETVKIDFQIDIFSLSKLCGCEVEEIYKLNPHLRHPVTPPYETNLYVPTGKAELLQKKIDFIAKNFDTFYVPRFNVSFYPVKDKNFSRKIVAGYLIAKPRKKIKRIDFEEFFEDESDWNGRYLKIPVEVYAKPFIIHIVKRGESLWSIARRYGVSVRTLKKVNSLRSSKIFPKQRLYVPLRFLSGKKIYSRTSARKVKRKSKIGRRSMVIHIVRKGETLYSISRKYGVSIKVIKKVNSLRGSIIYPGQKLYIPVGAS